MTQNLVTLAYRSQSVLDAVSPAVLADILTVSQRRNVENEVTGALAYGNGHFVQVLEGPEASVLETIARIRTDPRHHSLEVIGPTPIKQRDFLDWSMASLVDEPHLTAGLALLYTAWPEHRSEASALLKGALEG